MGSVGGQGVIGAIEDGDGSRGDEGLHCGGLLGVGADGDEALPVSAGIGGADAVGVIAVETRGRDVDGLDDGCWGDAGIVHGGGG